MGQVGGLERLQAIMASNLASELSGTQVVELVMRLGRGGLTAEKAKELMGDDKKMEEFVKNGLKKDPYLAIPAAGAYERYAAKREGRESSNHYRLHVDYELASLVKLSQKYVKYLCTFDEDRSWVRHSSCENIDETSGERDFFVLEVPEKFFGRLIGSAWDELAKHLGELGYRFAIEVEAEIFGTSDSSLGLKYSVLVLGSFVMYKGSRHALRVNNSDGQNQKLSDCWSGEELVAGERLLVVRK